jgi:hypothetical protein
MKLPRSLALLVAATLSVSACKESSSFGLPELVLELRNQNAVVLGGGALSQSYLAGEGTLLKVDGLDVQAFEYLTMAAASADAATISSDGGTIGTTAVTWGGSPHFYRRDRIIALYVGNDLPLKDRLTRVMGAQIAGR